MWTNPIILFLVSFTVHSSVTFAHKRYTSPTFLTQKSIALMDLLITHDVLQKKMKLQGKQYNCFIPIMNQLITPYVPANQTIQASQQVIRPLRYKCAIYHTKQFVYELCSGQHVRQFDDQTTIQNMNKKAVQKFMLGLGNKTSHPVKPSTKIISSVAYQNRYIVINGIHGRTNYRLPYEPFKYGNDRIEIRCHNNILVSRNILLVSHYHFIILGQPVEYCFSRQHNNIFIDSSRIILINSLLAFNNILVGECNTEGMYVFLRFGNGALETALIKQKINSDVHILNWSLDPTVKAVKCESYFIPQNLQLETLNFNIAINGYVMHTQQPIHFVPIDSLIITYLDKKTKKRQFMQIQTQYSFSNFIHLLKQHIDEKIASNIINVKYLRNQRQNQKKVRQVKVRQPDNYNTSESSSSIFQIYNLKAKQKMKINIKNSYIVIKGGFFLAKLIGNQWTYYLKSKSLKVRVLQNGSKQVIHENKHYDNTTMNDEYFHINEFCIWAQSDHEDFCRLAVDQFHTIEAIEDIQLTVYNLSAGKTPTNLDQNSHLRMQRRRRQANPVVYEQTYTGGDYCAQPIGKPRNTTVVYICGENWFGIKNVSEASPCQYKVYVESQLMCQQGYRHSRPVEPIKDIICLYD